MSSHTDSPTRLPGVDGLRGFAAMWVVLFHIYEGTGPHFPYLPGLDAALANGYLGVSLFLVLSGFCLYLPFANGRGFRFRMGEFWRRRCRRLLPAYYVAIVFALAMKMSGYALLGRTYYSLPQLGWQVFSHTTFIYTLFPDTFYALNGAFWSLGLEWQLYIALPALIWSIGRFGFAYTLAAALLAHVAYAVGVRLGMAAGWLPSDDLVAYAVLPNQFLGRWAEFLLGMLAAELYARKAFGRLVRPTLVTAVVLLPVSILVGFGSWPMQQLLAAGLFGILVSVVVHPGTRLGSVFAARPLVRLGTCSYGIYLLHAPIVAAVAIFTTGSRHLPPLAAFAVTLGVTPVILCLAWLLYIYVERPFLTGQYSLILRRCRNRRLLVRRSAGQAT